MNDRCRHSLGYWLIRRPNHPYSNGKGFVPEHRLVMEGHIGRFIDPSTEEVHHRNEVVTDNDLANLQLVTRLEHGRLHAGWRDVDGEWWKPCPSCRRFLRVEGNFYRRRTGSKEYVSDCKPCSREKALRRWREKTAKTEGVLITVCLVCDKELSRLESNITGISGGLCGDACLKEWTTKRTDEDSHGEGENDALLVSD